MKEIKPSVRKSKSLLYPRDFLKKQGELENMPWASKDTPSTQNKKYIFYEIKNVHNLYIVHGN